MTKISWREEKFSILERVSNLAIVQLSLTTIHFGIFGISFLEKIF